MTDLNNLMVFLKVVELGSFTLAADALGLPKSNISRKVTKLEQDLGVLLLERSTRSLHLTEIGDVYFQHCRRIYEEVNNAEHCIQAMSTVASGTIKVCCSVGIGQVLLTPLIAKFRQQYPLINLVFELTNRRVDIIEEGFDLVIRVGESPDSNLISKKLMAINMYLYASQGYLAQSDKQGLALNHYQDIVNHSCLFMSGIDGKARWELFEESITDGKNQRYIEFTPTIQANDFLMLKMLAEQDQGITLLPDYFVKPCSTLQKVLPDLVTRSVNLYAVYPSRKGVTPKIRAFLEFLKVYLTC